MNVAVLIHAPFERLGQIRLWLEQRSAVIHEVLLYQQDAVYPPLEETDLVIVLGGPMSVNEEDKYPWLVSEKAYIREVVAADIPLLGICLGGQLIATALGSSVTLNPETEIGWHQVERTSNSADVFQFPPSMEIFNWHGETFELPQGAVRLLRSRVCENQGFQIGRRIIGLQCHPEVRAQEIQQWVDEIGGQMVEGDYVQSPSEMLDDADRKVLTVRPVLFDLLAYLTAPA
ncbi:type 1 glutamine amidotransferase [Thiomicrorhabdus xiamenensis]|uniref:Gamma-glutamyl-gamma-aminobutyrate hydrolase family protein n=1 Tax=Thiomicrorhabdus xiamenensis TaxID=2739063 RepID=A0A7D4NLG8_9GAMM|nr:type 1 glutamine amidotransferase [Thiomicrorhabdus xiamenensis]QKI90149.1 gamma-glutamyl-gamma-aminobutyrate hydrolase family protein [Thiomicrorhabdus xiamenensis]